MSRSETFDESGNRKRVAQLVERGVEVWGPERVYVAADVPLENIEPGAVLVQGSFSGSRTRIGRGSRIGASGHAQISDCQIGRDVELGAGYYQGATLLDRARVRGYAELRPGTLLEEEAEGAHSVAFKNTILTATVVTGSLINFCDIFMSGGTSRSDHSEVGSGVIHFNFDPRGDKYGSLLGDVRGVLLRSPPVFVGGQCGLVGPLHVDFGAVVAAGSIVRKDVGPDCVHFEAAPASQTTAFDREIYTGLKRKFLTTAKVIGNLRALDCWYEHVRLPFAEEREKPLYQAAQQQARTHIAERVKRLENIVAKLERSIEKSSATGHAKLIACQKEHRLLIERRQDLSGILATESEAPVPPARFLDSYEKARADACHLDAVRQVDDDAAVAASDWLGQIAALRADRLGELLGKE